MRICSQGANVLASFGNSVVVVDRSADSAGSAKIAQDIGGESKDVVVCLARSACGSFAAALAGKTVALIEPSTGKVLAKNTLGRRGTSITFANIPGPSGASETVLLSTDANSEVRAWPLPGLEKNVLLLGHAMSLVSCAAAHPEGHTLATGDREGRVRLTCLPATGLLQGMLFWHKRFVTNVAWVPRSAVAGTAPASAPDSSHLLVSGAADGCLAVWDAAAEPPACLGTAAVAQHMSSGPIASPAVAAAAAAAPTRVYAQESNAELMRRASGSKPRASEESVPLSHVVRSFAVVENTLVVSVFGVPQLLFFALSWSASGVAQTDPGKADDANAVTLEFTGRASLSHAATDMTPLAAGDASEAGVLVSLCNGSCAAVGIASQAVVPSAVATAVSSALTAGGCTEEHGSKTDSFVPSPYDMAFSGGAVPLKALKELVSNSASEAAAFGK